MKTIAGCRSIGETTTYGIVIGIGNTRRRYICVSIGFMRCAQKVAFPGAQAGWRGIIDFSCFWFGLVWFVLFVVVYLVKYSMFLSLT